MRLGTTMALGVGITLLLGADAPACDGDPSEPAFILRGDGNSTEMMGSLDDLRHARKTLRSEPGRVLWTRIDGEEYVVSDPALLDRASEIFRRGETLDGEQERLERDLEALERREETFEADTEKEERALDERQEALDAEQERVSRQMTRDLEALVREAIRAGRAKHP